MTRTNNIPEKLCLATITSETFIQGTLVMLHSFLKHNPWFGKAGGDIVIIHDSLPPRLKQLTYGFDNVKYMQVGQELKEKVDKLCAGVPQLKLEARKKRFYSLDIFRLAGYRNLLFCDSDILFLDDISGLINAPGMMGINNDHPLLGCGDVHYFTNTPIDAETFLPKEADTAPGESQSTITQTFNAGFLIVDKHYLTTHHHHNLLELLNIDLWSKIKAPHTDQIILNLYFNGRCHLLSARYNYLLLHYDAISTKEDIPLKDIKVLHFNGKSKPWESRRTNKYITGLPILAPFFKLWQQEFLDFLTCHRLLHFFRSSKPQTLPGELKS